MDQEERIVLFDGVCNLCNSSVDFILKRDEDEVFSFASLQSEYGEEMKEKFGIDEDTLILVEGEDAYTKSSAYIKILGELGGLWKFASVLLSFIPKGLRDFFYNLVADRRYRLFGKKDVCRVPDEELEERFISEKS